MKMQLIYTRKSVAGYMASVHQDDKVSGTLSRLWDNPTSEHDCAMLVLPPMPDFTVPLVLDSVPVIGRTRSAPVYVEIDTATDDNSMCLTQDDDMVRIDEPGHAIAIAMHLLAWAFAEQQPKTDQEES